MNWISVDWSSIKLFPIGTSITNYKTKKDKKSNKMEIKTSYAIQSFEARHTQIYPSEM